MKKKFFHHRATPYGMNQTKDDTLWLRLTKDSSLPKQKMIVILANWRWDTIPPHLKPLKNVTFHTFRYYSTQNINNQQERREEIALSQASLFTINKDIIFNLLDATPNPWCLFKTKTFLPKNLVQKVPTHKVISLFKINLKDCIFLQLISTILNGLISYKNLI